jgi:hypothetical protein
MTDDLEQRLRDHLRRQASRASAPPDVTDLRRRVDARDRRITRALGAGLAIALLAGPVAGWAFARSTESDRNTVTAAGGQASRDSAGAGVEEYGGGLDYSDPTLLDVDLEQVSARTTGEGVRLVVHSSGLGQSNGPCITVDGVVRVGIVDGDLIDVRYADTAPGGASFVIAGTADDRPIWVVVVRGFELVEATFPNGAVDAVEATDGLAVLAAYADPDQSPDELMDDVIQLQGSPMVDMADSRRAAIDDGSGGCSEPGTVTTLPPEQPAMPEPGEPPADEEAARAAVEDLWLAAYDGAAEPSQANLRERPEVWLDAQARFRQERPDYAAMAPEVYAVVHDIVFTAPDRASVRFSLLSDNPSIPAPGERIGEAVLIDGAWKVSIETSCGLIALAGVECNYSLEG